MVWLFFGAISLATVFIKLGALTVWVTFLLLALKAMLVLLGVTALIALWRHLFRRNS